MRDFLAILVIILAVVGLGVFRVPNEDALVAAGIGAEARAALSQARHPLQVSVDRRTVTLSGRVESDADRRAVLEQVAALDGVEEVRDALVILPQAAPFSLRLSRGADGTTAAGHVPDAALDAALAEVLGQTLDLPVAAGVPDDAWSGVVLAGARALGLMLDGRFVIEDRAVRLDGRAHLPAQKRAVEALFRDLPEGYEATVAVTAVDDGTPYRLTVTRDPLMGLRLAGKLPPDFDPAVLEPLGAAQDSALTHAPLALDQPGFAEAVARALPVFAALPEGALVVAPGVVTVGGGPVGPQVMAEIAALRDGLPNGYALQEALVPEDSGAPLRLTVEWDGAEARASGRVPADVALDGLTDAGVARSPYPDLAGWAAPLGSGLDALRRLDIGTLTLDGDGLRLAGIATGPEVAEAVRTAVGDGAALDLTLMDDGAPARFALNYDAATGARIEGKLPPGLTLTVLAGALGLPALDGPVTVAPDGTGAEAVLDGLTALAPWLPLVETLDVTFAEGGAAWDVRTTQGASAPDIAAALPPNMTVTEAAPVGAGSQRLHALRQEPQVFATGLWLPDLGAVPDAARCATLLGDQPALDYGAARLEPSVSATWPLARLTAVARACTRFAGLTLVIEAEAGGGTAPILDRQRARRRAEGLRAILVARGVPEDQITATGTAAEADSLRFGWN